MLRSSPTIVAARRTAIGTAGGALAGVEVAQLAAPLLAEAATAPASTGAAAADAGVDAVILGNCLGPGGNVARVATLAAGLSSDVPATTVDLQCGSGLQAVAQAAVTVAAGGARLVLAGGVESASTAPWRYWPPSGHDAPRRYTRAPFAPAGHPDPEMGPAADALAVRLGIARQRQDAYAARSHRQAWQSMQERTFDTEILAVHGVSRDQRPRPGMTAERLARLPPAFGDGGTATAGNSSGISDGAAIVTVVDHPRGTAGLRIRGIATIGCDPALPGRGAGLAIRRVLDENGATAGDLGAVEVTEAFAAVALATIDIAGLDERVVCAQGGAIGYGHPWGASGAICLVRLFSRMVHCDGPELGVAACAVGGGQGIAMLVQRTG